MAYTKIVKLGVSKLDDCSLAMVFIGYANGTKSYRLLDPTMGTVIVFHDVILDKSIDWFVKAQRKFLLSQWPSISGSKRIVHQVFKPAPASTDRGARKPSPQHVVVAAVVLASPMFVTPPPKDEDSTLSCSGNAPTAGCCGSGRAGKPNVCHTTVKRRG